LIPLIDAHVALAVHAAANATAANALDAAADSIKPGEDLLGN
jgi:hypothetical protein